MNLFPNIGLERRKFSGTQSSKGSYLYFLYIILYIHIYIISYQLNCVESVDWRHPKNRRKFFETIAQELSLDPLIPETWYSISPATLEKYKVIKLIKYLYNIILLIINYRV